MATLNDAYRKIGIRMNERVTELAAGGWMDDNKTPEWHGAQVMRLYGQIAGLREALLLIDEIQRDN